jgi:outer membrane protein TolC
LARYLLVPASMLVSSCAWLLPSRTLAVSILALARVAGATGTAAPPAMTLPEAIAYARAHHPSIASSRARVAVATASAEIPRARWLPTAAVGLEILVGTTNNTTASYTALPGIALPRIGATKVTSEGAWGPRPSTVAALGIGQELFDFGRIAAWSAASDALVRAERFGVDSNRLSVDLGVSQGYFAVLGAHEIVKASDQAYERARAHRDEAAAKVTAGLRPAIDLTRASADFARYEVGRTRARGGLLAAQGAFAAAVGMSGSVLDARGEPPPLGALPPLSTVLDVVISRHPDLARQLSRIDAAAAEARAIESDGRPEASLGASLSGREGGAEPSSGEPGRFNGWIPDVPNWDVAVTLAWPFLDGVRSARVRAAEERARTAQAELAVTRSELLASARDLYATVQLADASLLSLQHASDAAHANYAQAEARFQGGLATTVELADAEALRTQAEIELAIGRFELFRARATLSRLMAERP